MTPAELDASERAAFVTWRRGMAALEEGARLTLTPFEKNLEVWRQLWRVVERSHVVVQARKIERVWASLGVLRAMPLRRRPRFCPTLDTPPFIGRR